MAALRSGIAYLEGAYKRCSPDYLQPYSRQTPRTRVLLQQGETVSRINSLARNLLVLQDKLPLNSNGRYLGNYDFCL